MAYTAKQLAEQLAANEAAGIGEATPQPGYENMTDRYPTKQEPSLGRKALRAFDMGDATGGRMPVHAVNMLLDKVRGSGDKLDAADTSGDDEWEKERLRKLKEDEASGTDDGKNVSRETKGKGIDLGGVKDFMTSPAGLLALVTVGRAIAGNEAKAQGNDTPIFDYARGTAGFLKGKNDADEQARKEALEKEKINIDKLKAGKEGRDIKYDKYVSLYGKNVQDASFVDPVARENSARELFPTLDPNTIRQNSTQLLAYNSLDEGLKEIWRRENPELARRLGGAPTTVADTASAQTKAPATASTATPPRPGMVLKNGPKGYGWYKE